MSFAHLHVHSHYSLLDGLAKPDELVKKAVEYKMPALALTDHGAMYGSIEFYKACKDAGIKPIIGMEAYVAVDKTRYHLTLLAKNNTGYKNLMKLSSIGWLEGFYYKPCITKEQIKKLGDGIIVLSGCLSSEINQTILHKGKDAGVEMIKLYQSLVGPDNFYMEIQDHPEIQDYIKIRPTIIELAESLNIPLVATNDVHYINKEDNIAQDALVCVQTGKKMDDPKRMSMMNCDVHFTSPEEMKEMFHDVPESLENTLRIASQVAVEIELGKWHFPKVDLPESTSAEDHLKNQTAEGIHKKLGTKDIPESYQKRIDYELDIINTKGYAPYFLVVSDIVEFARAQEIITTTRGSAAGSLVSYAMGITTADPMSFELPFERFLNPFRPSPPDIDLDIEDARRGEVIQYVREKYGEDKVAHIITFGTLLTRAAVRDVGRVLNLPYSFCDKVAKMIPLGQQGSKMTFDRALKENPEFKKAYDENEDVKRVVDLAKQVEGCVRHASLHAAGVVVAPTKLTDFSPAYKDPSKGDIATQYDMHAVEDAGLLKLDLLGITNLSILGLAREIIKRTCGKELDLQNLPLDDTKTYKFLTEGNTMGVFQLAGSGMTRHLKELKPTNIFDIMAMISLYRPGPMESIPEFIARKHNPQLIQYPHPKLEKILQKSYGIITYQDDVLLTAIELAGYNWEEADKLRKAIGKKIPEEMAKQKTKFIEGCITFSNVPERDAEQIWALIEPFAAYGFNKAHGSSYALVAYQTAYVKANYTVEYMAALLTCEAGNMEKAALAITECGALGITVFPPDINESRGGFTVVKDKKEKQHIRFGLNGIKHLGAHVIDDIIDERKKDGPYDSLENFLSRVTSVNKKSVQALIRSGAFDRFGKRAFLEHNTEAMLGFGRRVREEMDSEQESLFAEETTNRAITLAEPPPELDYPLLAHEKEYLGLYITAHPLHEFKHHFDAWGITYIQSLKTQETIDETKKIQLLGTVETVKPIRTKKGDQMFFVTIEDFTGSIEIIVFPKLAAKSRDLWNENTIVYIEGKASTRDDELKVIANTARIMTKDRIERGAARRAKKAQAHKTVSQEYFLNLPQKISKKTLVSLRSVITQYPGNTPVYLRIVGDHVKVLKTNYKVTISGELEKSVQEALDT